MKILKKQTKMIEFEIGDLDHRLKLPTAPRIKSGMETKCDVCGEEITDEFFIGGFKKGLPNIKFHERCGAV
jgi:hypothetical protein